MTASSQHQLTCTRCGAAFTCGTGGRDGRCWCVDEAYRVPMPAVDGGDCLCLTCLRAHAQQIEADARR